MRAPVMWTEPVQARSRRCRFVGQGNTAACTSKEGLLTWRRQWPTCNNLAHGLLCGTIQGRYRVPPGTRFPLELLYRCPFMAEQVGALGLAQDRHKI